MRDEKRKTADAATPAIRMHEKEITESVPQKHADVNIESAQDSLEMFYMLGTEYREAISAADDSEPGRVRCRLAEKYGIGTRTVERAGYFATGINAIRECSPETADRLMQSAKRGTKQDVQAIGQAAPEERKKMIDALISGKRVHSKGTKEETRVYRSKISEIEDIVSGMFGTCEPKTYTIDSLLRDIAINTAPVVSVVRQMLTDNRELCAKNKSAVVRALLENVIFKIEEIEEEIMGL